MLIYSAVVIKHLVVCVANSYYCLGLTIRRHNPKFSEDYGDSFIYLNAYGASLVAQW